MAAEGAQADVAAQAAQPAVVQLCVADRQVLDALLHEAQWTGKRVSCLESRLVPGLQEKNRNYSKKRKEKNTKKRKEKKGTGKGNEKKRKQKRKEKQRKKRKEKKSKEQKRRKEKKRKEKAKSKSKNRCPRGRVLLSQCRQRASPPASRGRKQRGSQSGTLQPVPAVAEAGWTAFFVASFVLALGRQTGRQPVQRGRR